MALGSDIQPARYSPFRWTQVRLEDVGSEKLSAAFAAWLQARGGASLPTWDTSAIADLPNDLIPFVNVIDVGDGQPPFDFRFFGSGLANMHTFELTNKTSAAIEPEGFRHLCEDQHSQTIEAGEPLVFVNEIPSKTEGLFMRHVMLRMPYSDGGETVSKIMTAEESESPPEKVWERFREDRY